MILHEINLDDFDKAEFLAFIRSLCEYFYTGFDQKILIVDSDKNEL